MNNVERFGVFLPTFVWSDDGPERARGLVDFARQVEQMGFDSVFVTDHLLTAHRFYSVSFLEPISTLAMVAGVTERVKLGTSVMVLPIRQPVVLAKQLATLQFISQNRVILGAGIGWYPPEYAAVGTAKSDRGDRTDEILDIIVPLLDGRALSHQGRFYSIDEVTIEPRLGRRPPIWIGGGSQLADSNSPESGQFAEAVKARILRAEGWIPRPTCPPEEIKRDWVELQRYLSENGRDPATLTVAHENFLHLVTTNDPNVAREQQHQAFARIMSDVRGPAYLEKVYLFGTPEEIVISLQARIDAGVERFMLHTLTPDPRQLELWLTAIVPHVKFPTVDPLSVSPGS